MSLRKKLAEIKARKKKKHLEKRKNQKKEKIIRMINSLPEKIENADEKDKEFFSEIIKKLSEIDVNSES